ncbi:MAG: CotH kinase family protein, partial [Moraxellaceae bacterium]|nr:CotH kinase family protein [Moraxellaceae bacterium]
MSKITAIKPLVSAMMLASLMACGGGGDDAPSPQVTPTPTPTPTPVLDTQEAAAIKDDVAVYAVEKNQVLKATVTTTDTSTWTFADVNNDADDSDANVPEIDAHFVIDGFADDGKAKNATLRLRGHSTRLADQKSYRIKLAKDAGLWRGEQTLQFNKHPYDLIRVRNKLAFDLFRDIPHIPSLRTQFVQMQITNFDKSGKQYATNDYGLFTHVEKMGKEYLVNRKLPTDGNIYKAED